MSVSVIELEKQRQQIDRQLEQARTKEAEKREADRRQIIAKAEKQARKEYDHAQEVCVKACAELDALLSQVEAKAKAAEAARKAVKNSKHAYQQSLYSAGANQQETESAVAALPAPARPAYAAVSHKNAYKDRFADVVRSFEENLAYVGNGLREYDRSAALIVILRK